MSSDEKYPTLYSSEGRQLISDHLTTLDNDEYKTACKKMRAAARDVMQHHSQFLADFCELDDSVATAVRNCFSSSSDAQICALRQRIHDLSNVDEWGDNLTLIALVYAFEISAKLYQVTATTQNDARVIAHPAIAHIARPSNTHFGQSREILLLHSPSHWQAMLSVEQAKKLNLKGPLVVFEAHEFMVFGIPPDNSCQFGAFFWAGQEQGLLDFPERLAPDTDHSTTGGTSKTVFAFLEASEEMLASLAQQLDGEGTSLLDRCKPQVLTLNKNIKVDFYRTARHKQSQDLYCTGLKMTYKREEWVLRNLFYGRLLTSSHTVAFLEHEDGRDPVFIGLKLDNCPVVPCKPYQFITPEGMNIIGSRKMTTLIEEYYSDKFRNLVGEETAAAEPAEVPNAHIATAHAAAKRAASTRSAGSAAKKSKHGNDEAGPTVSALEKELDTVGTIALLSDLCLFL